MEAGEPEGWPPLLRSHQPSTQEMQQPENPVVARAKVAVGWPEVEEVRAVRLGQMVGLGPGPRAALREAAGASLAQGWHMGGLSWEPIKGTLL